MYMIILNNPVSTLQSSSVLSGAVQTSTTAAAVYPSAIAEQQRERERERIEISRAQREREMQSLQLQRRNSHDRRTSFDSILDADGRHRTPHRTVHHQVHFYKHSAIQFNEFIFNTHYDTFNLKNYSMLRLSLLRLFPLPHLRHLQ